MFMLRDAPGTRTVHRPPFLYPSHVTNFTPHLHVTGFMLVPWRHVSGASYGGLPGALCRSPAVKPGAGHCDTGAQENQDQNAPTECSPGAPAGLTPLPSG